VAEADCKDSLLTLTDEGAVFSTAGDLVDKRLLRFLAGQAGQGVVSAQRRGAGLHVRRHELLHGIKLPALLGDALFCGAGLCA
jgi:hypothetical protein